MIYANGWGRCEATAHLTMNIAEDANVALNSLPMAVQTDYDKLVKAMSERFDLPESMAHLHRAELESRVRRKGESLPALAQDISRLAALACPGCSAIALADVSVEGFIKALPSAQHRYTLRSMRPRALEDAVYRAMELESHATLERMRGTNVHSLQLDDIESEGSETSVLAIAPQKPKQSNPKDTPGKSSNAPRKKGWKPLCIACGTWGHYLKDCNVMKPFFEKMAKEAGGQASDTSDTSKGAGGKNGKRKNKKGKGKDETKTESKPNPFDKTNSSGNAAKQEN